MQNFNGMQQEQNINMQPNQANEIVLATFFERTIAFVIDVLLCVFIFTFVLLFLKSFINIATYILLLCFFAYFTILTAKFNTIGKWLLGIKVVDKFTKQNITFAKSFIRTIGYILCFFTCFFGFILALFSKRNYALEDLLAKTEVISIREKSPIEITILSFVGIITIALVALFSYNSVLYAPSKEKIRSAQNQLEKIAFLEELHKKQFGYYTNDILRLALLSGDAVQFQRDMQQNLRRQHFVIGIKGDSYYISSFAKDSKNTEVFYDSDNHR